MSDQQQQLDLLGLHYLFVYIGLSYYHKIPNHLEKFVFWHIP